jgi:hypothetical protein
VGPSIESDGLDVLAWSSDQIAEVPDVLGRQLLDHRLHPGERDHDAGDDERPDA